MEISKRDKDRLREERDDVAWVIGTQQGRRFLWRLLAYCKVHHDIGGPIEQVYKDLGKRNVGLFIEGIVVDASEDKLFEMMREAKQRAIEENIKDENDSNSDRSSNTGDLASTDNGGPAI